MTVNILNSAKVYGYEHITYTAVFLVLAIVSLVIIKLKVKSDRAIDIAVKCFGGVLLALIIFNRIAICVHKENAKFLIPDSFCGIGSFGLAISCLFFKRGAYPYHIFVYLMFFGGMITTFYPDFIGQLKNGEPTSFMYPATISGLLHHSFAWYVTVFLFVTEHFKPSVRKTHALPIAVCVILVYGLFLMDALKFEDAMYIHKPLIKGTFVTWYVVEPALVAAAYGFAFLYEYITKKKKQKTENVQLTIDEESTS